MSAITQLPLAIVIGTIVGLVTSIRRFGGFITFVFSTGSFVLVLLSLGFRFVGLVASPGGVGIVLVILGFYFWLSMWARSLRTHTPTNNNRLSSFEK